MKVDDLRKVHTKSRNFEAKLLKYSPWKEITIQKRNLKNLVFKEGLFLPIMADKLRSFMITCWRFILPLRLAIQIE